MGKASSSKKVARAAKAGTSVRAVRERPKLAYPLGIFAILVIGSLLVFYARGERTAATDKGDQPPKVGENWQEAYGVSVCGAFKPPFPATEGASTNGVSVSGDGIMSVQPQNGKQAGSNARLDLFAETVGMKLGKDSITLPDGTELKNGMDCNGQPAKVTVTRWGNVLDPASTGEVFESNFGDIRFKSNEGAFTFSANPAGATVPMPESTNTMINAAAQQAQSSAAAGAAGAGGVAGAGGAAGAGGVDLSGLTGGAGGATGGATGGAPAGGAPAGGQPASGGP